MFEESQLVEIEEESEEILSDPINTVAADLKVIKMFKNSPKIERYKKEARKMNLSYTRVVVPTHMRSRYWKYFGFPADDAGDIVTKDQIVCTICNIPINFHKNTTNLRSHLIRHHKDADLGSDDEDSSDQRQTVSTTINKMKFSNNSLNESEKNKSAFGVKKIKIESSSIEPPKSNMKTFKIIQAANPLIEAITTEAELLDSGQITADAIEYQDFATQDQDYEIDRNSTNEVNKTIMTSVVTAPSTSEVNLIELIQQMIITDVFPTSISEGAGFTNLIWTLCGNIQIPTKKEIERSISRVYEEKSTKLFQILQTHSASYPFSLGIELWTNTEKKTLVTIYFNYIPHDKPTTFNNVLFTTVELSKYTNFEEIFQGVTLRNCSAAVINSYNNIVASFLQIYDIPSINCFDAVIQRCMKLVFNLPEINSMFSEIHDLFYKHSDILPDASLLPRIDDAYPWTKYNLLKYFYDNVTFHDENDLMLKTKTILECLQSFKITIETLVDEPNAVSSLIKPLASKLVDQYFQPRNNDYELAARIKDIVGRELKQNLLVNNFLIVSSFLDPRFHSFVNEYEMDTVYQTLNKKISNLPNDALSPNHSNNSNVNNLLKPETSDAPKRSSLKLFFDDTHRAQSSHSTRVTIEQEITKYRTEVFTDLEQCPLDWWSKMGYIYGQLKLIADQYKCVPCCINNNFKKTIEEQIDFNNRRLMLRGSAINQLLFLHYNKKFLN